MKKQIILIVFMGLWLPTLSTAKEPQAQSVTQHKAILNRLNQKIAYFYQQPNQADFNWVQDNRQSIEDALTANKKRHNAFAGVVVWVSQVADKHQWKIQPDYYPSAIKQLNTPGSRAYQIFHGKPQITPQTLDMWWSSFFATGDMEYVKRIFNQAKQLQKITADAEKNAQQGKKSKRDILAFLVAGAAEWSFLSNCRQHAVIQVFAKKQLSHGGLSAAEQTLLTRCVSATGR